MRQTCFNWKPAFFSVVSHWILSHTACVSGLPGSRILLAVILPKNLSTDWRGISFNRALHTYGSNHIFHVRKIKKKKVNVNARAPRTCSPAWTSDDQSAAAPAPIYVLQLNWWPPFHHSCAWPSPPLPGTKALWPPLPSSLCWRKHPEPPSTLLLRICRLRRLLKYKKPMPQVSLW